MADPDREQAAETIFAAAVEQAAVADRAAYLDRACAGDAALRRWVEALLAAHAGAVGFLEAPPPELGASVPSAPDATVAALLEEGPGTVIGRYKLLERIGEGGMGVVFMAQQQQPVRRKVALKVIKAGMDTRQVVARFEAERQALALMDHPNIAKVLDGGATDAGRPYFVMELVQGVPITEYCDHNQLTARERLGLFAAVCRAVQHAHTKGVIHRDLKPNNVLVTLADGVPVPKVIDFGIAKAAGQELTDKTLFTQFAQMVGTPLYMSPEQAAGGADVDTRSDVYSLGVLLYELLTGTTPFDKQRLGKAAYDEVRRIIREEDPPRPSTRISSLGATLASVSAQRKIDPKRLGPLMRGELDWIVMRALEKDRARRYETASGLGQDVERYLADEAVQACPPSAAYRFRKFARRNKGPVLAVGAVVLALAGGVVGTTWQAVRANRERVEAVTQRNDKQRALDAETAARRSEAAARDGAMSALRSLTDEVVERQMSAQRVLGPADRAFLQKIVAHYEAFAALKGETLESRCIRAEGHLRISKIRTRLGELAEARAAIERGLAIAERLVEEFPADARSRALVAYGHHEMSAVWTTLGKHAEAAGACRRAIAGFRRLSEETPGAPDYRHIWGTVTGNLGIVLAMLGDRAASEAACRESLDLLSRLVTDYPAVWEYRQELASRHANLGGLLAVSGSLAAAEAECRRAIAIRQALVDHSPDVPDYRRFLADDHMELSRVLNKVGRHEEAVDACRRSLTEFKRVAADFPAVPAYQGDLARGHLNMGATLSWRGRLVEAEAEVRQARELSERLTIAFPHLPDLRSTLASTHDALGDVLRRLSRPAEGAAECRRALAIRIKLADDFPGPANRDELATSHHTLANMLIGSGDLAGAIAGHRRASAIWKQLVAEDPGVPERRRDLALCQYNLGVALGQSYARTRIEFREALAGYTQMPGSFPGWHGRRPPAATDRPSLARLISEMEKTAAEHEAEHRAALAIRTRLASEFPSVSVYADHRADSHDALAHLLSESDRSSEAVAEMRRALGVRIKLAADFPSEGKYRTEADTAVQQVAHAVLGPWKRVKTEAEQREAIALCQSLVDEIPGVSTLALYLNTASYDLARLLKDAGKPAEALEWYARAIRAVTPVVEREPDNAGARGALRNNHWGRALAFGRLGRSAEAVADWERAIALANELCLDVPGAVQPRRDLANCHAGLGHQLKGTGKLAEAEAAYRAALAVDAELVAAFPTNAEYAIDLGSRYHALALCLRDGRQPLQALEPYGRAIATLAPIAEHEARTGRARGLMRSAHWGRAVALEKLDRFADALPDWDRVVELEGGSGQSATAWQRTICAVRARDDARAFAEADALAAKAGTTTGKLYDLACHFALASASAKDNPGSADRYAARAVELLVLIDSRKHFALQSKVDHMKRDADLTSVRGRADYQALVARLARAAPPAVPAKAGAATAPADR